MDSTWQVIGNARKIPAPSSTDPQGMTEYIRMRVRCDAGHCVSLARNEAKISHPGIRGRFRELLIDNLLAPWLPPSVEIGTGVVIDPDGRCSSQQDVVIYDRMLMPSVLASGRAPDGVFPINAVLACVEVKSRLTREDLRTSLSAAASFENMKFAAAAGPSWPRPINLLFAYDTDLAPSPNGQEDMLRLVEVARDLKLYDEKKIPPGPIVGLCVVDRGAWMYASAQGDPAGWLQARRASTAQYEEILLFVGALSNTCFGIRAATGPRSCSSRFSRHWLVPASTGFLRLRALLRSAEESDLSLNRNSHRPPLCAPFLWCRDTGGLAQGFEVRSSQLS